MQGAFIFKERPGKVERSQRKKLLCKNPKMDGISSSIIHGHVSSHPLLVTFIEQSADDLLAFFLLAI